MNRSGYYKWRQRQGKMNRYERDREELTRLLQAAHEKYPSHGYHRLAHDVFLETGWVFSHNLAHTLDVPALLDAYVLFFNNHRPAAALGYRSPVQFKTERGF